jgi:signal transduction histidine kinase
VYFAVNELLTNAAKHAGTTVSVRIALHYASGVLTCDVRDDGPGGADPSRGTGLRGITSRLAVFDGTVRVDSPIGGPTNVLLEVPCAIRSA